MPYYTFLIQTHRVTIQYLVRALGHKTILKKEKANLILKGKNTFPASHLPGPKKKGALFTSK